MEATQEKKPFKLNYKRTMLIGFAFFGILLLWQVYDSWCPTLLSELFAKTFDPEFAQLRLQNDLDSIRRCNEIIESYQYPVGIMMAIDNLAALILLPIFGNLSDKTHTKLGKRMPYILVGTFLCAVAFPFVPIMYHFSQLAGLIVMMAVVVIFAMMYRNPAVALMPDITPKPLRSKANGIINIMGYIGGAFALLVGFVFGLSQYLGIEIDKETGLYKDHTWAYGNVWAIELPFIIAALLMVISAVVLFITIKENKIHEEMKDEMARGDLEVEAAEVVTEEKPISKVNMTILVIILAAEFFWFMADNGVSTFMGNYSMYFLGASSKSPLLYTLFGGIGSVVGFALGGILASTKLGRKYTVILGLGLTVLSYLIWGILTFILIGSLKGSGVFPVWLYAISLVKGFGMSLVHINSFPMVVELCPNSKIGKYTGFYYAASMAAQTITPIALGTLLLAPSFSWELVPIYGLICAAIAFALFFFVKNTKADKSSVKVGLEGIGQADDD